MSTTGSVAITDIKWKTKNERVGYEFSCSGNKQHLNSCSRQFYSEYINHWYNRHRGGIECQMNTSTSK